MLKDDIQFPICVLFQRAQGLYNVEILDQFKYKITFLDLHVTCIFVEKESITVA